MACALLTPQDVRWLLTALFGFLGTLGLVFTLLYHLGRYAPGSQYRERLPFLQDLRACLPRGLLHLFFWPFVIALDSGALPRALQGLRVLFGSRAGPRPDLPPAPDRTDFASAAALRYVEEAELARARVHETAGGVERRRRLVILPHDSPELDRAWLLIGLARGPSGTVS
ncbi:hypothetical protein FJY71_03105, partial [candidate division WOR-3 bacterium]|nr:hypothetical protein [candidate division WOR-3 bacterium]